MNNVTHEVVNTTFKRLQQSTPINHFQPITDDTSSTQNHASNQDINDTDNSSEASESQSIVIKSINLNNNVSNDRDSLSNEIHNIRCLIPLRTIIQILIA
jgi:hypothetical protein